MSEKDIDSHVFIIIGSTGDLTRRLLLPALFELSAHGTLKGRSKILGVSRNQRHDDSSYRKWVGDVLEKAGFTKNQVMKNWCDECIHFQSIKRGEAADYKALAMGIMDLENLHGLPGNRVFYLAIPPQALESIIQGLAGAGLNKSSGWTRVVAEKPFGTDLASARRLNELIHKKYEESQIYRIDHFLGKETVQNLLVFRFANTLFEPIWNRDHVKSVHITVAEDLGIDGRAGYYESAGALVDMVQNHLTQLLTLVAMEPPASFNADYIRNEKVKVLTQVAPLSREDIVFGQYQKGRIKGNNRVGYKEEDGVGKDSDTETFVAMKVGIANWRWQDVPFFLRTGKRMHRRLTQIAVNFKCPPVSVFQPFGSSCVIQPNILVINIQPDEGFDLYFHVKDEGQPIRLTTQKLSFKYKEVFGPHIHSAYETLLLDIIRGDQTLFVRSDEVETAWKLYTPLFDMDIKVHPYDSGSWGPSESDKLLLKHDSMGWLNQ